jgi:hypothetical protein
LGYNTYIYTWKCHKETPCIDILNKQKCHFFPFSKSESRRAGQVLSEGLEAVGRGGYGERVKKVEYNSNTVFTCMKMEK